MEAGLWCPWYISSQVLGNGFQLSGYSRNLSEISCSSSCVQLSSVSQISGRGRSPQLAGWRLSRQGKNAPSALNVRCQGWSHFKLPNESTKSGDVLKRPESGGVNRLPGHGEQGNLDGAQSRRNPISPPGLGQFRPPVSTWVPEIQESEEERRRKEGRKAEFFEKLGRGLGSWQEKAGYIKGVQQLGVTSEELYELSFLSVVKQTALVVALQVYETLVESDASTETLEWFDEDRVEILYALRTLSARQRKTAADLVVKNSLNVVESQELARAIKDHERRPQDREGFTTAAGDCLAFMCYRAARECTDSKVRSAFVERGLRVAETDSARHRFEKV